MNPSVLCFGEVLWDHLPSGPVPGGAPMNVAIRLQALGISSAIISAVGEDVPGQDLTAVLRQHGVDTSFLQHTTEAPTGAVHVTLDAAGQPSYDIVAPSAWDQIAPDGQAEQAVRSADAFVFGTLACRRDRSRTTLLRLLEASRYTVLDVNLRPPHFSLPFTESLLRSADLIKMNEEELAILSPADGPASLRDRISAMAVRTGAEAVCVTRGGEGALLYINGIFYEHPGFRVTVADTVGAGDGFLAGFLYRWLKGSNPSDALTFGCAVGAAVAARPGANPDISHATITELLHR